MLAWLRRGFAYRWAILLYLCGIGSYLWLSHLDEENHLINDVDLRLQLAANKLPTFVAADLHERALRKTPLNEQVDLANIRTLSAHAEELGVRYLYSLILRDNKIYFVSSSALASDWQTNKVTHYLDEYTEAPETMHQAFRSGRSLLITLKDRWGIFRTSCMVQYTSSNGRFYACADYNIADLDALLLDNFKRSLVMGVSLSGLILPFLWVAARRQKQHITALSHEIHQRTQAQTALEALNHELEARVEERTARLAASVTDLAQANLLAQQANQAKTSFLMTMSHELRTPMHGIQGMLALLQGTNLDETQQTFAEALQESAGILAHHLDQMLTFVQLESGTLHVETQPSIVEESLQSIMRECRANGHAQCLQWHVHWPDTAKVVLLDNSIFQKIVRELLDNAIKFTPKGEISLELTYRANEFVLRIQDSGIGLGTMQLAQLFTPFAQGDGSITRQYGGLGLGLALARGMARHLGGEIHAHSEGHGKGSCFTVSLPVNYLVDD